MSVALVLSVILCLSGIMLYLWPQMRLFELGYRESALQTRRMEALQRQKELQVELSSLRQLQRVENIAVQHLGLRPPQSSQVIYVRPEPPTMSARREP